MHDRSKNILQKGPCCVRVYAKIKGYEIICRFFAAHHEAPAGDRRPVMDEPIMCPFCGGTKLYQDDDYGLELDTEYWTIHHWECMDCAQSFDKIEVLPASDTFEEINESTIH